MNQNHLIVLAKNPVLGKVKTRLAATIGKEKAIKIYQELLRYTCDICSKVNGEKTVFYSDFIPKKDIWTAACFNQSLQKGTNLGERMQKAFATIFEKGTNKVVIIGTDCMEINTEIINEAFEKLTHHDIVLGPALDGGYYLLGMNKRHDTLFENINWSTETVLKETVSAIENQDLSFTFLPVLNDIDEEKDLP